MATPTAPTQPVRARVRRICKPERTACASFRNASPRADITTLAENRSHDRPISLCGLRSPRWTMTSGQDALDVYVTTYTSGGIQGAVGISTARLQQRKFRRAGGNVDIEWNDTDVTAKPTTEFDNDPPPDAQYLASLAGLPVLISCNGRGRSLAGTAQTVAGMQPYQARRQVGQPIYHAARSFTLTTSNTACWKLRPRLQLRSHRRHWPTVPG